MFQVSGNLKPKELRVRDNKDLRDLLKKKVNHIREIRFNMANSQVQNIKELSEIRKEIARIKTILKEKHDQENF